ncbi:MAGE family-domain-containing protein [Myxozyma melibiosi]|uniref:MAGE family-domain-containing protein n=1 Tax=Myxozyma melibiosi TaxID=54550 RepID=A0ABR1FEC5_9ASCO
MSDRSSRRADDIATGSQRRKRSRRSDATDVSLISDDDDNNNDESYNENGEDAAVDHAEREKKDEITRLAKKLVKLALEFEHKRTPLRRSVINDNVLDKTNRRSFSAVFKTAQQMLTDIFGMTITELPTRSISQRPAAGKKRTRVVPDRKPAQSNKSYIITSTLDPAFQNLDCLKPMNQGEKIYNGLAMTVCTVLHLHGGKLHDNELMRYLRILKIGSYTPYNDERTTELLNLMLKHQYLEREKDTEAEQLGAEEQSFTYFVGPRAKAELSQDAVLDFIIRIYGEHAPRDLRDRALRALRSSRDDGYDEPALDEEDDAMVSMTLPSVGSLDARNKPKKRLSKKDRLAELARDDNDDTIDGLQEDISDSDDDDEEEEEEDEDEDEDDEDE